MMECVGHTWHLVSPRTSGAMLLVCPWLIKWVVCWPLPKYCIAAAGVVDCKAGTGSVELKRYPKSHAFAQLSGSDNIISFTTQRYSQQPLIVR